MTTISRTALWQRCLLPARGAVSQRERLRAGLGALLGILVCGAACQWLAPAWPGAAIWLIAPMGASAVLLFGLPASPLAQPWSLIGGNLVSALVGVSCARWIDTPALAAGAAIFVAMGAMFALRCVHPPSGAVALTAVLGGPDVHAAGYAFVAAPVALNSVLLLVAALVYNNVTGRRYPHAPQVDTTHPHGTADEPPSARLGFNADDLHAALREYDQVLDVSEDDLEALFQRTERNAFARRFGAVRCDALMSRDVIAVEFGTPLCDAWRSMRDHRVHALPVVDRQRRVIGIVTRSDFLRHAEPLDPATLRERLRGVLARSGLTHSMRPEVVGQIMSAPARTATVALPAVELVPLMSDAGHHHVPVVDAERRLVGIVTQADLVAALYGLCLRRLADAPADGS